MAAAAEEGRRHLGVVEIGDQLAEGQARGEDEAAVDLSRICAAPSARLGHLTFEGQGAFSS